ncbi:MAG: hypothetical protein RIB60_00375 [Phycisphaerales bacterium]
MNRIVIFVALLVICALPACSSWDADAVRAFRDDAASTRDALTTHADRLESERDALGPSERPAADAAIADLRARAQVVDAAVARLDAVLAEAAAPTDGLTVAAHGLGALLPEPVRVPLLLAGALAATLARAHQLKKGAGSIARSLETAMRADPNLKEAFARNADTFRTIQTPTARRIVDEQATDRRLIKLPI